MTVYSETYEAGAVEPDADLIRLINEAISLELNVARLYALFQDLYPEDAEFWQILSQEEENHALLLKIGRKHYAPNDIFPLEILPGSVAPLIEQNREIERLIDDFEVLPPLREDAFRLAVALEEAAGEVHFQRGMAGEARTEALKVFQTLNNNDRDHADRIKRYMEEQGIGQYP